MCLPNVIWLIKILNFISTFLDLKMVLSTYIIIPFYLTISTTSVSETSNLFGKIFLKINHQLPISAANVIHKITDNFCCKLAWNLSGILGIPFAADISNCTAPLLVRNNDGKKETLFYITPKNHYGIPHLSWSRTLTFLNLQKTY